MQTFPHHYRAEARAEPEGTVTLTSAGLPELASTGPPEFDGPEGYWSPETLLVATVSDCLVLTFRSVAQASRLPWSRLECRTEGVLDRVERVTRFTEFRVHATLGVPAGTDVDKAAALVKKAKSICLITNSFVAETVLEVEVEVDG